MKITPDIINKHGIKQHEYKKIISLIGKEPNLLELGIFSAMWNEHCSYKSSKKYLKTLPTKNKKVIQGPGENAGVVDIEDDDALVFKIESHNHPSFIEPYQGAATGVGGILRDVFTMGARPIATLNSIHFGSHDHPKTKNLLNGVVTGIGGYGNCMGIPTVGGEVKFNDSYNENILVNAMAVGLVKKNKIFYSKAKGSDQPVIYVGSKTGRDGIHGASMASAEFDENIEEKKPTVQVGDPFTEKLLLEACLELMKDDSIISIQDMGAAGLTSSSVEMASKGNLGIEINLDKIPCREKKMTPYEMMLSESQERMLLILVSGKALRITFKVHFNIKSTKKMASPIYGKSPEKIEIRQAKDFIKEFCNLSAGYIKKIFEDQSLDVGISLPLVIRGFDEVFFERQIKKTIIEDSFRIENSGIGVVCTNIVEIFNQNLLDGIDINVEEEEEEIDFL